MAYTPRNSGESDGHFELLDDKALRAMLKHLRHELGLTRKKHDRLREQAKVVAAELKRRDGKTEENQDDDKADRR